MGSLGIYARGKHEYHHGCLRFREEVGILGQCGGMQTNGREEGFIS